MHRFLPILYLLGLTLASGCATPAGTQVPASALPPTPQATTPIPQARRVACASGVGNATISCSDQRLTLESNGLPQHEVMVGIDSGAWNAQWPAAKVYRGANAFAVPRIPELAPQPTLTVRNAAGVAVNGVPIFFPHAPGKAGKDSCLRFDGLQGIVTDTSCLRDPVAAGEMDDCGGHTGRGGDYHYHGEPTCLRDRLPTGTILGYMLDGFPVYADPLPGSVAYQACGGHISPAGAIHYAFSDTYPYVTGCLLGLFQEGPRTRGVREYDGKVGRSPGVITDHEFLRGTCQALTFARAGRIEHCL